ncbi:MAG: NADH kinase [Thermoplasmata archaeon]|nr:MAG: NADH kinase [Thermoplasmata archaeon]
MVVAPESLGLVANLRLKNALNVARRVYEHVQRMDVELIVEETLSHKLGADGVPIDDIKVDVIVCVGGDGTILRTAQHAQGKILGINLGEIGFLTEVQPSKAVNAINRLMKGDYVVDRRMKLKVYVNEERLYDCLNEAVVHTASISKMRVFDVHVDEGHMGPVRADAIIVSTPTGSTCYALSAGGPILDPKANALLVLPLAPFKLTSRPLVVSARSTIRIVISDPRPCLLVLDGQYERRLKGDEEIVMSKSEKYAEFVRFGKFSIYDRIKSKLSRML